MSGKFFIKTHGCQMNEYDSDKMRDVLISTRGMTMTDIEEEADLILINTCSIREKAQEKVFSQLGRWRKLKDKKPGLVIGVAGCVASQEGEAIIKRAPFVDLVFGPQTIHRISDLLDKRQAENKPQVDISFPEIEKFDNLPEPRMDGPTAFVSIMEGCSKYCSFCVVPYTRGEEVSRPLDGVLAEIMKLAEQGVKEVNLLGQNVNAYRGLSHSGDIVDLALLIHYVAAIDGIERIRFTTSHPTEFSDGLIEAFRDVPELVNHLHLPVQSGSDRVLSMMKRNHTAIEYKQIIRKLREVRPNISLSSDFIIGFPGESAKEFDDTMKLINDIGFDQSFSFIYSARPGTPAASMKDATPLAEKKERLQRLQTTINEMAAKIAKDMVGTSERVLVEGTSKWSDQELSGKTENNRVVNFAGPKRLIGQIVDVTITEALRNSLRGRVSIND